MEEDVCGEGPVCPQREGRGGWNDNNQSLTNHWPTVLQSYSNLISPTVM